MTGQRTSVDDADIDLKKVFGAIWQRKRTVFLAVVLAGVAAFAVAKMMHPLYRAEAKVIIQPRSAIDTGTNGNNSTDQALLDDSGVTSQVQVLQSTDLAQDMIEKFELAGRAEFGATDGPTLVSRILGAVGLAGKGAGKPRKQAVLARFQDKLNVYKIANSRVIVVQFSSQDPKLAANLPNALVKDYLLRQSGLKLSDDSEAAAWLKPEIARLRTRVNDTESKVADYRARADLLSVGNNDTLASRELGDTASELGKVRSQRIDAEARASSVREALKSGRGIDTLANIVDSPLIQQLRQQEVTAQAQLADLSTSLGNRHPRIRALKSQIDALNSRIRGESRKVLLSLESEAGIARQREKDLSAQLDTLKKNAGRAGEQSVKLQAMQREASADRDLLNRYLARYRQASSRSTLSAAPADARIVSNAMVPQKPYFPKTVPIVIVAMLAAFLFLSIAIILSELFSGRALRPVEADEPWSVPARGGASAMAMPEAGGVVAVAATGIPAHAAERNDDARQEVRTDTFAVEGKDSHAHGATVDATSRAAESEYDEIDDSRVEDPTAAEAIVAGDAIAAMAAADVDSGFEHTPEETDGVSSTDAEFVQDETQTAQSAATVREPDFSIAAAAEHLIATDAAIVLCASPEGDEASAATVILTRLLAEQGAHIVLVDMTTTGYPTRLMAQYKELPGITDLLSGTVNFTDSLHGDRISSAHILPRGTADPKQAMRAADRLPIILDGLGDVYDFVLVECGACELNDIERLSRKTDRRTVLVTALAPANSDVVDMLTKLHGTGHDDLIVVVPGITDEPHHGHEAATRSAKA